MDQKMKRARSMSTNESFELFGGIEKEVGCDAPAHLEGDSVGLFTATAKLVTVCRGAADGRKESAFPRSRPGFLLDPHS